MQGGHFSTFYKKVPKDFLRKSPQKHKDFLRKSAQKPKDFLGKTPQKSRNPPQKSKKTPQRGGDCGCAAVPALPHSLGGRRSAKRKRTQRRRNRA